MDVRSGDDESLLIAAGTCLGVLCKHCSVDEVKSILEKPLGTPTGAWTQRFAHAVIVATVSRYAVERLEEHSLKAPAINSIKRFARDDKVPVKVAASRAASHLIVSEVVSTHNSKSLAALIPTLCAFLGPDQSSELQRHGMAALREISLTDSTPLQQHFADLVPSLCSLIQTSSGPTKLACEQTLSSVLGLSAGMEAAQSYMSKQPGPLVKSVLTEPYLRRLQKVQLDDAEEEDEY